MNNNGPTRLGASGDISFDAWNEQRTLKEEEASTCRIKDLAAFRLDADYAARSRVRRARRPVVFTSKGLKDTWFSIRPGEFQASVTVVQDAQGHLWFVSEAMRGPLSDRVGVAYICAIITTQGIPGIWVIPQRWAGKAQSSWNSSAVEIALQRVGTCIRLQTVVERGIYECDVVPVDEVPNPEWPDATWIEQIGQAFGHRVIFTADDRDVFEQVTR
ncbi:MAG: hypothetical protein ACOYOB_19485 [Myxococcota bacterium]